MSGNILAQLFAINNLTFKACKSIELHFNIIQSRLDYQKIRLSQVLIIHSSEVLIEKFVCFLH